jgi:hypothetical protein
MKKNGHMQNCDLGIEMMAYMYDEMAPAERMNFETHIADCSICTDEFAVISNSRFSVYEWKRDEFDPIATPRFVIPAEASTEPVTVGWLAGLRGLLTGWPAAVAFAAVATVFIGAGLFAFTDIGGPREVATTSMPPVMNEIPVVKTEPMTPDTTITANPSITIQTAKATYKPQRAIQAKVEKKSSGTMDNGSTRAVNTPLPKKPNLSNFDDDDDQTLRLADLFDDGGV